VRGARDVAIAIVALVALFAFGVPFPLVILAAGAVGWFAPTPRSPAVVASRPVPDGAARGIEPSLARTVRILAVGVLVWLGPVALVVTLVGNHGVIRDEATFFAVMSLVTFGGAYAVLAYVNQAAVLRFGWLSAGEMAVGLSLAETTPGPLILTVVFVAFVAAFRHPGELEPAVAGLLGGLVTAWLTFVPSFLWIFLGAPSVERLRGNVRLSGALSAITAAVVGVIANLAFVFAIGVLFDRTVLVRVGWHDAVLPALGSVDLLATAVAAAAFVAMWRYRVNVAWIVLASGALGLLRWWI
jgi:chromate transporter